MRYKKENTGYLIVLDVGEEFVDSIIDFAKKEGIEGGVFYGVGAMNLAEIGFFDLEKKEYIKKNIEGQRELLSLKGNLAHDNDGNPIVHCHVIFGKADFATEGGHLFKGVVSVTCEIFFQQTSMIGRVFDSKTGLKLWQLS
ncbi:DUF296 domain-containing protein [bacterium]|nr:DUF296 domain-containing protein [bacterium]